MKLHIEVAEEFTWGSLGEEINGFTLIEKEEGKLRRWSRTNSFVVKKNNKYFRGYYEEAATENQEVDTFSDVVDDHIELTPVKAVKKTITVYE